MIKPPYHYYYQPRESVLTFSEAMELALRANEHKGLWHTVPIDELTEKAQSALDELDFANGDTNNQAVYHHAVTVANYMMMIADNVMRT